MKERSERVLRKTEKLCTGDGMGTRVKEVVEIGERGMVKKEGSLGKGKC